MLKLEVPIEEIPFKQKATALGRIFAGCLQEEFGDAVPNATITIYVKQPKSVEQDTGD